ncbi:MAG: hypothetical protein HYS63_07410 [Methylocystis sp.]|nr:hypothetical protein [Methylocystis sp.]
MRHRVVKARTVIGTVIVGRLLCGTVIETVGGKGVRHEKAICKLASRLRRAHIDACARRDLHAKFDLSYENRLKGSGVIPDARNARDRESSAKPAFLDRLWIPGQAFGLPGMTWPKRTDQPESVSGGPILSGEVADKFLPAEPFKFLAH